MTVSNVIAAAIARSVGYNATQTLSSGQQNQSQRNIGLPAAMRGYLGGLTLSAAGGNTAFTIAPGVATDSSSADVIQLTAALLKGIGPWTASGGGGCTDTGTIAVGAWAHVYLIKRPDSGVVDACISANAGAPTFGANIPTAYTLYRRIGSIKLDSSGNVTKFVQLGDEFLWDAVVINNNASPGTTAIQTLTVTTPPGVKTVSILNVLMIAAAQGDGRGIIFSPDVNSAASLGTEQFNAGGYPTGSNQVGAVFRIRTNVSAQIKYSVINAAANPIISTIGYIDRRGRDD